MTYSYKTIDNQDRKTLTNKNIKTLNKRTSLNLLIRKCHSPYGPAKVHEEGYGQLGNANFVNPNLRMSLGRSYTG